MSDQAQARRRPPSTAGTGWSFLVVVSCGRSTNDHLRVPECRTVSGFWGRAETATPYPQFTSFDSAVRPSWAAAIAPALPTGVAGVPAHAGTPVAPPRARNAAAGNASCSGSSQGCPATSRPLTSTESRASRWGRSEPPASRAPGSLRPAPLGSTRRCRRTFEGEDRYLRPRSSWLWLVSFPPLVDADLQRLRRSPGGRASSRFIGWGGGAGCPVPADALVPATCNLAGSMAQWTTPTPTTTARRWCRGDQGLSLHADLDR